MKYAWDELYAGETYRYGLKPNRFLALMLEGRAPGSLLLVAEGEGRNAVYAAEQNWEVSAFDSSAVAREKALQWAQQKGIALDYRLASAESYHPDRQFDAVALIFAHFPPDLRELVHTKAWDWLKTGGELWLEAFAPGQLTLQSGGPKNEAMLYDEATLSRDFSQWQIRQLETKRYTLDEGPGHQGLGEVVRLQAIKHISS